MNWKDCIKDLSGRIALTPDGHEVRISKFCIKNDLKQDLCKYKVSYLGALSSWVGWFHYSELTLIDEEGDI